MEGNQCGEQVNPKTPYAAALEAFRLAARKYQDTCKAYRGRQLDDAAYLAGRAEFARAQAAMDIAEADALSERA